MKKKYIIKKKSEIDDIFKEQIRSSNSYFTIILKRNKNNNANFRFAMSIGRKYGNSVARNKIKRQIRSIIRINQNYIKNNCEFVIVIKPKANELSFEEINKSILDLLKKLKVMEKKNESN